MKGHIERGFELMGNMTGHMDRVTARSYSLHYVQVDNH